MKVLLDEVKRKCGQRGLTLTLEWCEVEDTWNARAERQGELCEAKRYAEPEIALNALLRTLDRTGKP